MRKLTLRSNRDVAAIAWAMLVTGVLTGLSGCGTLGGMMEGAATDLKKAGEYLKTVGEEDDATVQTRSRNQIEARYGKKNLLTVDQRTEIANKIKPQVIIAYGHILDDPNVTKYVSAVGRRLADHSPRTDLSWNFQVLASPHVNHYSLMDGTIYISRGLLMELANEAQLASVLSQEIANVSYGHMEARIAHRIEKEQAAQNLRAIGAALGETPEEAEAWNAIFGAMADDVVADDGQFRKTGFSDQETQASDVKALEFMAKAKYSPAQYLVYIKTMREKSRSNPLVQHGVLTTHVYSKDRSDAVENYLKIKYPDVDPWQGVNADSYLKQVLQPLKSKPPTPRGGLFGTDVPNPPKPRNPLESDAQDSADSADSTDSSDTQQFNNPLDRRLRNR